MKYQIILNLFCDTSSSLGWGYFKALSELKTASEMHGVPRTMAISVSMAMQAPLKMKELMQQKFQRGWA